MSLTTEQKYKPYDKWTEEEVQKIKENAASSLGIRYFMLNRPMVFSMIPMASPILKESGSSFTSISHLVLLTVSSPGYRQSQPT